jgi:hypothetical protein
MSLGGSNNAILLNNCKSLKNPIVTLVLNRDLITQGDNGFSLQLNCYPQTNPQAKHNGYNLLWFQYVITVWSSQVQAAIQYWSWLPGYDPKLKGHGYSPSDNYKKFASAASNQVQRGSVMRIELETDSNDNVTGAQFGITPSKFKSGHGYHFSLPTDWRFPIYGFQVNLVGPGYGTHTCTFTSAGGILTYQALDALAVQTTNTCGGPQGPTAETSNSVYGNVVVASSDNLCQSVGFGPNVQ